jgi:hypothetical protein
MADLLDYAVLSSKAALIFGQTAFEYRMNNI